MTAPADQSTTTDPAATVEPDATAVETTPPAPAEPELDEHAKKVIEAIRGDFKSERTKRQAAEDRAKQIETAVKTALGLEAAPPDPAALAAQLTETQQNARQAQIELAVFKAASGAGANASALLDSRSFVNAMSGVDPTDSEAIAAAITAAVQANPLLATAPARRAPGPNPAANSSANGAPDLNSAIAAAKKAGNWREVITLNTQLLMEQQQKQAAG